MRYFMPSALLLSLFFAAGCSTEETTTLPMPTTPGSAALTGTPVNDKCPIMGGDVTEDGGRVEWNAQVVGFCCPECIEKWNALSEDEKSAKLAENASEEEPSAWLESVPSVNRRSFVAR